MRAALKARASLLASGDSLPIASDLRRTAPLAFSSVFYIGLCAKAAIPAGMEDALLAAIEGTRKVFAKISIDTDTQVAEAQALDVLFTIAVSSYPMQAFVSSFRSVETMLQAALHDIRVRGYRHVGALLGSVLPKIATLLPLEVAMEKAGQRIMQTFPPYSLVFQANVPVLLAEIAKQTKPVEDPRSWVNPFDDFNESSETIVLHYRDVADKVVFDGVLLEKWVVDSIIRAAEVHIDLLDLAPNRGYQLRNPGRARSEPGGTSRRQQLPTPNCAGPRRRRMMDMSIGMMLGMGLVWILVLIFLILGIAACIKYLRS